MNIMIDEKFEKSKKRKKVGTKQPLTHKQIVKQKIIK